ncbi:MAG: pilus assembly protein PilM, partial [Planctomycetes bacterium]|nr:pilus assembly protein PilM [Planctomycetota bacterium]
MADRGRAKKILALDWDAHTLRVVHAFFGKRGLSVDRLLSVAIPSDVDPDSPEQMGRHIRRVLDQEGIATRHALVDIPRDQAILNTLSLPSAAPDELPGMVEIQIAKELPFPVGEAAVDFAVEQVPDDAVTSDVLVAAIRCEVLEQYVATFAVAGLKLDRVGLRPYANKVAACALLKHAMPDRILFLDVRPSLTEINVLCHSALTFSRAASVVIPASDDAGGAVSFSPDSSSSDLPDGLKIADGAGLATGWDGAIRSLVVEVTRSIEAYRANDPGAAIDHVVIGG